MSTVDLDFALSLADAADELTLAHYRSPELIVETKSDSTPVTVADRAVEDALRARIARERPGEAVGGEERGIEDGRVRWWLDPIDGTKQYARGIPLWATLIALERDGATTVAVVSAPALGHRSWAMRGQGAVCDGTPIHVSRVDRLEKACVSTTSIRALPQFLALARKVALARTYMDFWQYMLVAEGRIEAGCDIDLQPWDVPAPRLIVEEAGGRYTIDDALALASNDLVHDEIKSLLTR